MFLFIFLYSYKCFRSQLPETYASDLLHSPHLCTVCGLLGNKKCSNCHSAYYCSKEHQLWDWKQGNHQSMCQTSCGKNSKKTFTFPEYEIVTDLEPDEITINTLNTDLNSLKINYNQLAEQDTKELETLEESSV